MPTYPPECSRRIPKTYLKLVEPDGSGDINQFRIINDQICSGELADEKGLGWCPNRYYDCELTPDNTAPARGVFSVSGGDIVKFKIPPSSNRRGS